MVKHIQGVVYETCCEWNFFKTRKSATHPKTAPVRTLSHTQVRWSKRATQKNVQATRYSVFNSGSANHSPPSITSRRTTCHSSSQRRRAVYFRSARASFQCAHRNQTPNSWARVIQASDPRLQKPATARRGQRPKSESLWDHL